tara:strand:+ start:3964 stop:4143 length:180 start_codon:yes stop_codon:yes gene_type:complete
MTPNNEGFTVGELTITIGVLIIAFLIWSGISKKEESKNSHNVINDSYLVLKSHKVINSI